MQNKSTEARIQTGPLDTNDFRIYLDNAATTPLDKEVLDAMLPYLSTHFGNPSSIYSYGRETRLAIENARKTVSRILGVKPGTIFFTSGGTESNNTAIASSVKYLGCTHVITSPIEHHAVLHTVEHYADNKSVTKSFVALHANGKIDYDDLAAQLLDKSKTNSKCLVSLMHANNEIGTLLDLQRVGEICRKYNAVFHSDCVQTVGHYPMNLNEINVQFISAASHKFHGPKGVGILYVAENTNVQPFIFGGSQERNMRAGTENVYGIVGFAKALEIASRDYKIDSAYITELKNYMADEIKKAFPEVSFNGGPASLYTVLSVCFPKTEKSEYLLMNLDMHHICASGGSACSSGADAGSHVMKALNKTSNTSTLRFSFSKYNSKEEIDVVIKKLQALL